MDGVPRDKPSATLSAFNRYAHVQGLMARRRCRTAPKPPCAARQPFAASTFVGNASVALPSAPLPFHTAKLDSR
jgi:hypothetical protein